MNKKRLLTLMGGIKTDLYKKNIINLFGSSLISYKPLNESSGTVAYDYGTIGTAGNGTYIGATVGVADSPGGGKCPYFDGDNDVVNNYSAAMNTAFNGQLGSIAVWYKADDGVWIDSTDRDIIRFNVDANNYIFLEKGYANNSVWYYRSGGVTVQNTSISYKDTSWHLMSMSWSRAAGEFKAYMDNGTQIGTIRTIGDDWAGALSSTSTVIGGKDTVVNYDWKGNIAHVIILNRVILQSEIQQLFSLAGTLP